MQNKADMVCTRPYVKEFQDNRKGVTDEILKSFMKPRKLEWKGNPNPAKKPEKSKGEKAPAKADANGAA